MVAMLALLGAMMAVGCGTGYFITPKAIEFLVPKLINLAENGMVYPIYMAPPFPMKSRYYLYEIKNKREFLNGGKVKLAVKGPYVFTTNMFRDNITFNNGGKSVRFDSRRKLVVDEEASENLDERFWILNPIVVGVSDQVRSLVIDRVPFKRLVEPIVFNSVNIFLDRFQESVIVKRSPREFLEGTKVEFLEFLVNLANQFGVGGLMPAGPPNNVFGIVYQQNETVDNSEIWAGVGDSQPRFAEVISWHGHKTLPYWKGRCNRLEGTNGELYKPFIKAGKAIRVFLGPICRSIWLEPMGNKMKLLANGVLAYEYQFSPNTFNSPKTYPQNECFCKDPKAVECKYDGLMTMGACFFDAPIYFGRPKLAGQDRRIRSLIQEPIMNDSILPDQQSFSLDPITGTPAKVNLTFVGTFKLINQPYMRDMDKLQPITFVPTFAASESILIGDDFALQLRLLQTIYFNHKSLFLMGVMAGLAIMLLGVLCCRAKGADPKKRLKKKELEDGGGEPPIGGDKRMPPSLITPPSSARTDRTERASRRFLDLEPEESLESRRSSANHSNRIYPKTDFHTSRMGSVRSARIDQMDRMDDDNDARSMRSLRSSNTTRADAFRDELGPPRQRRTSNSHQQGSFDERHDSHYN